jgi:hypothetical protein
MTCPCQGRLPSGPVHRTIPRPDQEAATLLRRPPRLLPCIALGLALFLAQTGALLHAAGHAGPAQPHPGLHTQLCDACLSFSTIFSMAGGPGSAPVLPAAIVAFHRDLGRASLVDQAVPRAFRSRAPPRS